MTQPSTKQWMLGLPGHNEVVRLEDVLLLVKGGQLRPTDLVKKLGEPWKAASEISELSEYFAKPGKASTDLPKVEQDSPKVVEPPRPITSKVPRAAPVTARAAKGEPTPRPAARLTRLTERKVSAPEPAKPAPEVEAEAETPVPGREEIPKAETKPPEPAAEPEKPEAKEEPPAPESSDAAQDKPKKKERTRPVPKAAPRPKPILDPMEGKYYSPVDLLRSASFAFDPKKLLITALVTVPLMFGWALLNYAAKDHQDPKERFFFVLSLVEIILGAALILTALGFVTRRQLEGKDYRVGEIAGFTVVNLRTALLYPVLVLIPSLLALGVLWLLGFLRNSGTTGASVLKVFYILPMIFAFVFVLGAFVYQLALMYVPAAAAIEGTGLTGSVAAAWTNVRRQWGRVVLHWLIVTVAFGVITAICLGLAWLAIMLPDYIFADPKDPKVIESWNQFAGLFALYKGLAFGLGLTLPLSLFSTLGGLSYMSLRHPASAQLSPLPMEDTRGIPISRSGTPVPMEATNPADTRPAPPEATRPGPGSTPAPEISEDVEDEELNPRA